MIGIIPAAGSATRIHGLPKYLLPVGDSYLLKILSQRMAQVTTFNMIGVTEQSNLNVYHFKLDNDLTYIADYCDTMTETVLSSQQQNETIIFGMPDTYIEDDLAFTKLAAALDNGADVAVGLFYARHDQHTKAGMCARKGNQVVEVVDKTDRTDLKWLWGCLAWKPAFWDCLQPSDPHVGYGLPRAIERGMDVRAVRMDGGYWDCGTSAEYYELITHLVGRKESSEMKQVYG